MTSRIGQPRIHHRSACQHIAVSEPKDRSGFQHRNVAPEYTSITDDRRAATTASVTIVDGLDQTPRPKRRERADGS